MKWLSNLFKRETEYSHTTYSLKDEREIDKIFTFEVTSVSKDKETVYMSFRATFCIADKKEAFIEISEKYWYQPYTEKRLENFMKSFDTWRRLRDEWIYYRHISHMKSSYFLPDADKYEMKVIDDGKYHVILPDDKPVIERSFDNNIITVQFDKEKE